METILTGGPIKYNWGAKGFESAAVAAGCVCSGQRDAGSSVPAGGGGTGASRAYSKLGCENKRCFSSSPGSFSHLGTLPGSDLAGLAAGVRADGSCSSCAEPLLSAVCSGRGSGSSEASELQEGGEDQGMQLR